MSKAETALPVYDPPLTSPALPGKLRASNQTDKAYPLDKTLVWFLEEQARRTPSHPALICGKESLTYDELHRQANEIAHHLVGLGVGNDSLVGVCMERSVELVVALLAIVKAGGAYVPIDPDYPADRQAFMLRDSEVGILLTQEALAATASPEAIKALCLDSETWEERRRQSRAASPAPRVTPDSLVYMIYTSGSTGKPKGVLNVHRALVNRILWMQDTFELTGADRVLQKTPFSFDVSVWEFFWPLMTGAGLVMARPGGHRDSSYLVDTIVEHDITTMHFVPSMLSLFLTSPDLEGLSSLRRVMSSGEALPAELVRRFFARLPQTELHNLYGPTEAAIDVTHWQCQPASARNVVPIGFPIANIQTYILDETGNPVPPGETGELHIGGVGLARGYWKRDELTRERFVPDPFGEGEGARLYKTGDLARQLPDGSIEYLGRLDFQVKIRGFRIELGEIESVLLKHQAIREATVTASDDALAEKLLLAYLVSESETPPCVSDLREFLLAELPDYMVPARFVFLDRMPLLPNGKVDRKALPRDQHQRPELAQMYVSPQDAMEVEICRVWQDLLKLDKVGTRDNFFELGGNSLIALQASAELRKATGLEVPVVKLFQYPTPGQLADHLSGDHTERDRLLDDAHERATRMRIGRFSGDPDTDGVAIVGMVGRFPGASTLDELWSNLCDGVESITRFSPEEIDPGVDEEIRNDPDYVPARGIIADADKFDAQFFGIGPLEARLMDPQQRVFLELAWAALENAGHTPGRFDGMIGVYAGIGDNHYYPNNVLSHPELVKTVGKMIVGYGNEKDYVATRVSYALNLTGPSVSANTGCSTSLLAVDQAFKALVDFECDMALAGGVDIYVPQRSGQMYHEGGTFTRDGHCRPFDASATGTMFCDGAGIVVLRRLQDALAAGDRIYAVIRGSAKNNDGRNKVSFLAPSVEGQAQVISLAQAQANVPPETISLIEAHGTGTPLGDPIEIAALTRAFRASTDEKQFCHIGSIKGNIGHPTIASGVAGLIKTTLALYHEKIPATLHFNEPNPRIDFEASPFKVVQDTTPWPRGSAPRRAGVSSFGFGGTNVHAVLEEAPLQEPSGPSRPKSLLLLSARTPAALERLRGGFVEYLGTPDAVNLADTAYTLTMGREHLACREYSVCDSAETAAGTLAQTAGPRRGRRQVTSLDLPIVFMFPGQGSQYVNMGRSLYRDEPVFRTSVDRCCEILGEHVDRDLRDLLYPAPSDEETARTSLRNTYYTQPALFTIEYSLAQLWISLGVRPSAMVGHSIGEFVCACLAGVFSLEDVLPLVALRGRLMRDLPGGSMLSVRHAAGKVEARLPAQIQLAAVNGPELCVVAGPTEAVNELGRQLEQEGIVSQHLHTSHAFHSTMMAPIVAPYVEAVKGVAAAAPQIPFVSTCTGDWITEELATSPEYWGRHLRMPVLFSNAIARMIEEGDRAFLEVGPRDVLTTLARQHAEPKQRQRVVASLGTSPENEEEWARFLGAMGELWLNGVTIDWETFYGRERRLRVPLPTYPFERKVFWVDPVEGPAPEAQVRPDPAAREADDGGSEPTRPTVNEPDSLKKTLVGILERISGIELGDDLDEELSFGELGLDSLFLTQISFTLKEEFGVKVTMRELLEDYTNLRLLARQIRAERPEVAISRDAVEEAPTTTGVEPPEDLPDPGVAAAQALAAQADAIEMLVQRLGADLGPEEILAIARAREAAAAAHGGVGPTEDEGEAVVIPTNGFQRRLLALAQADPERCSPAFNESVSVSLHGPDFSVHRMREALDALVGRHEALRGRFSDDGTQLLVDRDADLQVPLVDLSARPTSDLPREFESALRTSFARPFDLRSGPLLRVEIIRVSPDLHVVVLTSHLTACDGWSMDVLVSELGALYTGRSRGIPPELAPPERLSDYVAQQARLRQADSYRKAERYWRGALQSPSPPLRLPLRAGRGGERTYSGARLDLPVEPELVRRLKKLAAETGCSFFTVLLASLKLLLRHLSGEPHQLVGMPTAGQSTLDKPSLVGPCLNYVPIVSTLGDDVKLTQYMRSLRTTVLNAIENSQFDFEEIARQWPSPDDPSRVPFIPVCLNMSPKMGDGKLKYEGLRVRYDVNPRHFESFELFVNAVSAEDDTLLLQFQFNDDLFEADEVGRWQVSLHRILERMAREPDERLSHYLAGVSGSNDGATQPNTPRVVQEILQLDGPSPEAPPSEGAEPAHALRHSVTPGRPSSALSKPLPPGDRPLYFGSDEELFGFCRVPKAGVPRREPDVGVLFCYPVGREYMRSHWAFRLLSNFLLARGFPVFKFDYFGTGDSLGDMSEADVDRWTEDVLTAASKLRRATGTASVSIVALRLGAVLAANAMERGLLVNRLVLWDPVVSGATYFAEIERVHQGFVREQTERYPFPPESSLELSPDETYGDILTPKLRRQLQEHSLLDRSFANCDGAHLVVSDEGKEYGALLSRLKERIDDVSCEVIPDDGDWSDYEASRIALLPSRILERLTTAIDTRGAR